MTAPTLSVADTCPASIPALLLQAAEHYGEQCFLEEGNTRISFQATLDAARRVAAALIKHGIEPGDRVAVWAPNISEWVLAALGAQCAGAILVTLNTRYKGHEAAYILQKSGAKALFCIDQFLNQDYLSLLANETLPALYLRIRLRAERRAEPGTGVTNWEDFLADINAHDLALADDRLRSVPGTAISDILFTSGTTGNPKGVMTSHAQNLRAFSYFSSILGLEPGDRYLVINPFFHSFGYKAGILACLLRGVTLLPHAVFDAGTILQRIAQDRISVMPGPPTLFQSLLAHSDLDKHDISTLKKATTGAAVIPVALIEAMKNRLGIATVITAYGLTESCGLVTMCRQGDSAEVIATTSGRAIPGIELRCVNPDNQPVAAGQPGEIVCRGFNVMQGYFDQPDATRETIDSDGWLHTGDIGILDEDGNLRITDRLKDMFITGGFNCYPAEIEKILTGHPAIAMSAVIGMPDERLGEVALAFVVNKTGAPLTEAELVAWCRDRMANYKVPRAVRFVDALPLNASGKVVKPELRKLV